MNTKQMDQEYIVPSYKRFDVAFTEGKGSILKDETGKEYIDFGSGIAVNAFGISDELWERAVCEQVKKLQHASNLYYTAPQVQLAQQLCEKTGMRKVFFSNSGAEANECMVKAARKYGSSKYGEGKNTIITLKNSFHGRTITMLSATGQDVFHQNFGPFTQGFVYAEPDDFMHMQQLVEMHDPCGIMIELVQGEGGVHVLDQSYVKSLEKLCREKDILLMVDEVQTGNGRTGALYAYMKYNIRPDMVSTAKGLAGGLPFGATLFGEKTQNIFMPGDHGTTFGGNPVCAAGALSILTRLDQKLFSEVEEKHNYIMETLKGTKGVKSVTGLGLMLGIEGERPAADVVNGCLDRGLAVLTAKTKVRLLPALNIPMDLLRKGIEILKEELAK